MGFFLHNRIWPTFQPDLSVSSPGLNSALFSSVFGKLPNPLCLIYFQHSVGLEKITTDHARHDLILSNSFISSRHKSIQHFLLIAYVSLNIVPSYDI